MKFGQYELLELIATGGMAEVYRGRVVGAEGFEKFVAIKRIIPDLSEDDRFVKMLLTEARIHAGLSHRNIVQIHDLGISESGEYFIVLEYVDGYDLRMIMEQLEAEGEIIPEALSLHIASELAQGLHFAHEQRGSNGRSLGLVHRDVSPSNVLISKAGEVKLSDFGLAKRMHDRSVVGSLKGNLSYMSPEQARQATLDRRTDIFSLGVVLFEMLTGKRLREITNEVKAWNDVAAGMIPSPRSVRPDLPDSFERLLARALAPEPAARFPTAAAFGAEIRALLSQMHTPVGASDLQALVSIVNPPRKPRSLMERSKVIRLGPEGQALDEAAKRDPVGPAKTTVPPARGIVLSAPARPERPATPPRGQVIRKPPPPPRQVAPTLTLPPGLAPTMAPSSAPAPPVIPPRISYLGTQATLTGVPTPEQMQARNRAATPVGYPLPPAPRLASPPPSVENINTPPGPVAVPPPRRSPSGPPAPPPQLRQSGQRPSAAMMSAEAMAVAATLPALARPEPGGRPSRTHSEVSDRPGVRAPALWPPVLLGFLALLSLAAVAVHFVVMPLDVLASWWTPAELVVISDPPGATILLDGTRLSEPTPAKIPIARDRYDHVLELARPGYRRIHQVVRFDRARSLAFEIPLQKESGAIIEPLRARPLVVAIPQVAAPATAPATDAGAAPATDAGAASDGAAAGDGKRPD